MPITTSSNFYSDYRWYRLNNGDNITRVRMSAEQAAYLNRNRAKFYLPQWRPVHPYRIQRPRVGWYRIMLEVLPVLVIILSTWALLIMAFLLWL
jgi:hypothetical protein